MKETTMKETTITVTVTKDGKVLLDGERIGSIAEQDDAYRPHEGRALIHALPHVAKEDRPGSDDDYALERAAIAVAAWHTLRIETGPLNV